MTAPKETRGRFLPPDDSDQMVTLAVVGAISATAQSLGRFYAERLRVKFGNAWRRQLPIAPPTESQLWDPSKTFIFAVENKTSPVAQTLPRVSHGASGNAKPIFDLLYRCHDLRNSWYHVDVAPTLANAKATIRTLVELTKTIGLNALGYLTELQQRLDTLEKGPFMAQETRELAAAREQIEALRAENVALQSSAEQRATEAKQRVAAMETRIEELSREAASRESLERDLAIARGELEEAREAQSRAEREVREASEAQALFERLKSARVEGAEILEFGARWPHGKGRTSLRLDPDFKNVLDLRSGRLLSEVVETGASEAMVKNWLQILPRGGHVWMDEGGYCCAYDQSLDLVYLGCLGIAAADALGGR